MNILVIDVGTSSMRGILFAPDGSCLFSHRVAYHVTSSGRYVEEDPSDWTDALQCICAASARSGHRVDALTMTCQRSSVIPVDVNGKPLRKAIMWQDTRNSEIVSELQKYSERISLLTGARLNTVFSGSKITWIHRNEPELYAKTKKFCTIADYLTAYMTGNYVTDETYGSRSLLMGLSSRKWEQELLNYFEVDREKLCSLIAPAGSSGSITEKFSECTGIAAGIPLISAGGDQQCGALGQGIFHPGRMSITFGTSACILKGIHVLPKERKGILCGTHSVPGDYVLEGSVLTCGAAMDWLHRTFYQSESYELLNDEILASPPGAHGVTALPNFQGSGTPDWNSSQRGGFLHINLGTSRADLARALLESIVYEIVNNIERMDHLGEFTPSIHIGGGLTKNKALCHIMADASGKPVLCSQEQTEDTAFGAWMNAAVAVGLYSSYDDAYKRGMHGILTILPDANAYSVYQTGRMQMNDVNRTIYP